MRLYGIFTSKKHFGEMFQFRFFCFSGIQSRASSGLTDNIPCYQFLIAKRTFHILRHIPSRYSFKISSTGQWSLPVTSA